MKLGKALVGAGLTGLMVAGTMAVSAAPAAAASTNYYVQTVWGNDGGDAWNKCWAEASRRQGTLPYHTYYYYCAGGPSWNSANLWLERKWA
ncbi:hypothetical protein ABZX40_18210 [Streptomyces sp. NPDC004610]|uniref:hypothetical protein n=1 Tax=unclassified Streptomyces TaxID=2593676 RepID=UPI0033A1ADC7